MSCVNVKVGGDGHIEAAISGQGRIWLREGCRPVHVLPQRYRAAYSGPMFNLNAWFGHNGGRMDDITTKVRSVRPDSGRTAAADSSVVKPGTAARRSPRRSRKPAGVRWFRDRRVVLPLSALMLAIIAALSAWYLAVVGGQWLGAGLLSGGGLVAAVVALVMIWRTSVAPPLGSDAGLLFSSLDTTANGRVITDGADEVAYANARWRTMTGVFRGDPPSPFDMVAGDAAATQALDGLADLARGGGQGQETLLVDMGVRGRWWWRFVAGEAAGDDAVAWQVSNLSEEGATTGVALNEQRLFGRSLDAAGFGLLVVNPQGRIRHANDRLAGWLGADAAGIRDQPLSRYAPGVPDSVADVLDKQSQPILFRTVEGAAISLELAFADLDEARGGNDADVVLVLRPAASTTADKEGENRPAPTSAGPVSNVSGDLRFERYFAEAPVGIATVDVKGRVLESNQMFQSMFADGFRDDQLLLGDVLVPEDIGDTLKGISEALESGRVSAPLDVRFDIPAERQAQLFIHRMDRFENEDDRAIVYLIDTTDQKNLEMQFAQSQKMQAVGQLAGGVAHDFNNLLTAISGFCDLLLVRHGPGDQSFADIMQIRQNANRAANLVRQLLAFSRQQTLRPKVLIVTDVLAELSNLVRRLIGEDIELKMIHGRNLGAVKVDQGQLEQVIINLAVNARDAMPEGGTLIMRTANISHEESKALGHTMMPAGEYILLEVADTGTGIPKEHIGKIFEPFFSTKEVGKGTGLGLSTVYGIVKQTGGFIFPFSETGKGAVFRIYLPVHDDVTPAVEESRPAERKPKDLTGKGTVLLVEDEDAVRTFASRALMNKGYQVFEADSGEAALRLVDEHDGDIDLLISDVVMPQMDGPTLVREIRQRRHDMKIIFISGYAEDAFRKNIDQDAVFSFLPKPFSLKQLAEKVKDVLESD